MKNLSIHRLGKYLLIISAILLVIALIKRSPSATDPGLDHMLQMRKIGLAITKYANDYNELPKTLTELYNAGVTTDLGKLERAVFICPFTGHKVRDTSPIEKWADIRLVPSCCPNHKLDLTQMVAYCPAENHHFKEPCVSFWGGTLNSVTQREFYNMLGARITEQDLPSQVTPAQTEGTSLHSAKGLVIDQDGNPVSGAKVVLKEWGHSNPSQPFTKKAQKVVRYRIEESDSDGLFDCLYNLRFISLLTIQKNGYLLEPASAYKSWRPDFPTQMRTPPEDEPFLLYDLRNVDSSNVLVSSTTVFHYEVDGTDYYVNLETGVISSDPNQESDLAFSVKQVGKALWLLTVRATEGGIYVCANPMPYAPRDGYVHGFSILYGQGYAIRYRGRYDFFAKTRDGKHYSRITADFVKKPQTIQFQYVLNRGGGRFLYIPTYDKKGLARLPFQTEGLPDNFEHINVATQTWWREQRRIYPILPEELFENLFYSEGGSVGEQRQARRYVGQQLYTPVRLLDELSLSDVWQERTDVAENLATPTVILKRLSSDPREWVRRVANETLERDLHIEAFLSSKNYFRDSGQ